MRRLSAFISLALALTACAVSPASSLPPTESSSPLPPVLTPATLPTPPLTPAPTPSPSPAPTPSPIATPAVSTPVSSGYPAGSVVVTFAVAGEEYRVLLTDPQDIDIARRLLAGKEAPSIPNGLIVRGDPSVNVGWSWHIDPDSIEFADMTTEVCDGKPSYVEDGTLTSDRFCPWSARVVAVEPANP